MKKYRIIKDYYTDTGEAFYYVQQKKFLGYWGTPSDPTLTMSGLLPSGTGGYITSKQYESLEEAKDAVKRAQGLTHQREIIEL